MDKKDKNAPTLKNWLKKNLPSLYRLSKGIKAIRIRILRIIKRDTDYFYDENFAKSPLRNKVWVDGFCELILKTFNPGSLIDFGCGSGDILSPFERKGIEVLGIDGSRANRKHRKIKDGNFLLFDIRNKYESKKRYDLCLCLEVAEHIEEKFSDILINNITQASSVIVFTAAPPGQIGQDHVNLKPYDWWIEKFKGVNFGFDRSLTEYLKKEMMEIPGMHDYYAKNLLIFKMLA